MSFVIIWWLHFGLLMQRKNLVACILINLQIFGLGLLWLKPLDFVASKSAKQQKKKQHSKGFH